MKCDPGIALCEQHREKATPMNLTTEASRAEIAKIVCVFYEGEPEWERATASFGWITK